MYKKPEVQYRQPQLKDKIHDITGIRSTASDWESYFNYLDQNGKGRNINQIVAALCDVVEQLEKEVYGTGE